MTFKLRQVVSISHCVRMSVGGQSTRWNLLQQEPLFLNPQNMHPPPLKFLIFVTFQIFKLRLGASLSHCVCLSVGWLVCLSSENNRGNFLLVAFQIFNFNLALR